MKNRFSWQKDESSFVICTRCGNRLPISSPNYLCVHCERYEKVVDEYAMSVGDDLRFKPEGLNED